MFDEFLSWYLAPWRRMGRVEFGAFLAAVSVPGFLLMILGFADSVTGWLAPVAGMLDIGKQMTSAANASMTDPAALQDVANQLTGDAFMPGMNAASTAAAAAHFDWPGLVNNVLLLALVPLCRMRLRDMGKTGKTELVWTVLLNVSPLIALLAVFGVDFIPLGWAFGLLNFGGYIWLCMAASAPRVPAYERIPAPQPQQPVADDPRRQDP